MSGTTVKGNQTVTYASCCKNGLKKPSHCSGLIEPDTLMRDNISLELRCSRWVRNEAINRIRIDFKLEAVALVREQGYSVAESAKQGSADSGQGSGGAGAGV